MCRALRVSRSGRRSTSCDSVEPPLGGPELKRFAPRFSDPGLPTDRNPGAPYATADTFPLCTHPDTGT